ncbi:MAG: DUF4339 domain-containing protein [Pirellulales bacterium]
MGIKFFCPNGHKLNVKSFLAGKRGICPRCGIGVDIPTQSDPARLHSSKKKKDEQPFFFSAPVDLPKAASPNSAQAGATGSDEPEPLFSIGPVSGGGPVASAFPASPTEPDTLFAGGLLQGGQAPSPTPTKPTAATPAAKPVPKPQSVKPSVPAAKMPAGQAKPAPKPALAAPSAPVPPAAAVADPLSEAPNAVWYLRPASGGQYGPAVADLMRQWIAQGRVAGDSLVWREGWSDWRLASDALGSLGIVQPAANLPASGVEPGNPAAGPLSIGFDDLGVPREESSGRHRISSRQRFKHTQPLVIMILLLALVVLIGVLIAVLANQPKSSSASVWLRPAGRAERMDTCAAACQPAFLQAG